jgi:signal transduction histidine kinase
VRHRVEPGLRAAGLTLSWEVSDAPCVPALEGSGGRELVRVVQEALSNVLHHAAATRVTVRTEMVKKGRSGRIVVAVIDNGIGLPATPAAGAEPTAPGFKASGRGTRNMHQRAQRLGATLSLISPLQGSASTLGGPGTEVRIELPMAALQAKPPAR